MFEAVMIADADETHAKIDKGEPVDWKWTEQDKEQVNLEPAINYVHEAAEQVEHMQEVVEVSKKGLLEKASDFVKDKIKHK